MSEFLFDKAKMALKSQRYDEASSAYEKILETSYNVEAWTGLGVCKMFQIADGRSMQEVLYCFEKARQVEGANNLEIDLKLIQYAQIVILQCSAFAVTSIQNALEAEKNAKTASLISLVSVGLAAVSNSTGVKILAGAAAATAAGVAVGQFGKMTSSKEIAKYAVNLLENIYNNVFTFLIEKDRTNEAKVLKETTEQLINHILDVLDVTRAQERILMENLEKEGKALDEYNEKVVASLTDEELISLASSFADLGFITKADTLISPLSFLSFDNLSDSNILKLVNNDTILFSLKSFSGTHYFCKNGILSYTKIYYPYLSIKSLEKNWIGGIKDKQSGYLLDLAMGGPDWQSIVINFINIKKKTHDQNPELPMASTSEKIMIKAILTLPTSPAKHFAFFLKLKKLNTNKEIATIMSHSFKTKTR